MNVTCPECSTVYRLPDEKAKKGAKLRCSVCRCVFKLPEIEELLELPKERPLDPLALAADGEVFLPNDTEEKQADASQNLSFDAPSASSTFDILPESHVKDDLAHVSLHEEAFADTPEKPQVELQELDLPEKKKAPLDGAFGLLLCLAIIAGSIWAWNHTPYLDGLKTLIMPDTVEEKAVEEPQALIEKLEIVSHQSYQVKNDKLGTLTVLEGRVRNNFTDSRELIHLEAELLDAEGKTLAAQSQIAGVSLNSFQLEVLDKDELEKVLKNTVDIVSANINVLPGSEVPFTVVFTEVPAGAVEYKVRIVNAQLTKRTGSLKE